MGNPVLHRHESTKVGEAWHGVWIVAFSLPFHPLVFTSFTVLPWVCTSVTRGVVFLGVSETIIILSKSHLWHTDCNKSVYKCWESRVLLIPLTLSLSFPPFSPTTSYVGVSPWSCLAQARSNCFKNLGIIVSNVCHPLYLLLPFGRYPHLVTYWDPGSLVKASSQLIFSILPLLPTCPKETSIPLPGCQFHFLLPPLGPHFINNLFCNLHLQSVFLYINNQVLCIF